MNFIHVGLLVKQITRIKNVELKKYSIKLYVSLTHYINGKRRLVTSMINLYFLLFQFTCTAYKGSIKVYLNI